MLEKEEFEEVSGCLNLIEGTGNVINKNFSWIITGKLFTEIVVPETEISCKKSWSYLFIPVLSVHN